MNSRFIKGIRGYQSGLLEGDMRLTEKAIIQTERGTVNGESIEFRSAIFSTCASRFGSEWHDEIPPAAAGGLFKPRLTKQNDAPNPTGGSRWIVQASPNQTE
jgi:hypothetical protein